jgi:hypothetical protein
LLYRAVEGCFRIPGHTGDINILKKHCVRRPSFEPLSLE